MNISINLIELTFHEVTLHSDIGAIEIIKWFVFNRHRVDAIDPFRNAFSIYSIDFTF